MTKMATLTSTSRSDNLREHCNTEFNRIVESRKSYDFLLEIDEKPEKYTRVTLLYNHKKLGRYPYPFHPQAAYMSIKVRDVLSEEESHKLVTDLFEQLASELHYKCKYFEDGNENVVPEEVPKFVNADLNLTQMRAKSEFNAIKSKLPPNQGYAGQYKLEDFGGLFSFSRYYAEDVRVGVRFCVSKARGFSDISFMCSYMKKYFKKRALRW